MSTDEYFDRTRRLFASLAEDPPPELASLVQSILRSWDRGGGVLSFGNGGSAADSIHFTTELVAKFRDDPIHRPAQSLASNPSSLTAISNDWSYEDVFARQVRALGTSDDVVLGISTSGNSSNVLRGLRAGQRVGAECFGLTGTPPGAMGELELPIVQVPSDRTSHVQEGHIACLHWVCDRLDRSLNG